MPIIYSSKLIEFISKNEKAKNMMRMPEYYGSSIDGNEIIGIHESYAEYFHRHLLAIIIDDGTPDLLEDFLHAIDENANYTARITRGSYFIPMRRAIQGNKPEMVRKLLELGALPDKSYFSTKPANLTEVGTEEGDEIEQLLIKSGVDKREFYHPDDEYLSSIYQKLYIKIKDQYDKAKAESKPFLIILGELHYQHRCFYIEVMVTLIARQLGITEYCFELDEERSRNLSKISPLWHKITEEINQGSNGLRPGNCHNVDTGMEEIRKISKCEVMYKYGTSFRPGSREYLRILEQERSSLSGSEEGMLTRNIKMRDEMLTILDAHDAAVMYVGLEHIRGLTETTESSFDDDLILLPINVTGLNLDNDGYNYYPKEKFAKTINEAAIYAFTNEKVYQTSLKGRVFDIKADEIFEQIKRVQSRLAIRTNEPMLIGGLSRNNSGGGAAKESKSQEPILKNSIGKQKLK